MPKTKTKIISGIVFFAFSLTFFAFAKAETLKIGYVTDWEYGNQKEFDHKLPRKAEKYLNTAVSHYNTVFQPDFVIGGGDYILSRGISKKKARKQLRHINNIFTKATGQRLYCIGNHDLSHLSKEEVQASIGIDYLHSVTDTKGMRLITLDTNFLASGKDDYGVNGRLSDDELIWLDEQLNTDLPIIVFSHQGPIQTPNGKAWRINILNENEVRTTLEKYGNVVAVFSGHHAINYSTEINGINYVIINNLTDQKAKGAYADISVETSENNIEVSVSQFGKKPASYSFSKTLLIN